MSGAVLRAFVALDLDATSLRRVARVSDRLRMASGAPSATWTPADKMHVTLKFVETLSVDAVEPMGRALLLALRAEGAGALLLPRRFTLQAFPRVSRASLVVIELLDEGGAIAKLAASVETIACEHGAPREKRRFRPHVTLARLKRPYDARKWLNPVLADVGECRFAQLTLYRSELSSRGSTYTPLAQFGL